MNNLPDTADRDPAGAPQLTKEQKEEIATMAATKAVELMTANAYQAVGKSFVSWAFKVACALALAAWIYLQGRAKG